MCVCVTWSSCPLGLSPIPAPLQACTNMQGRGYLGEKKKKTKEPVEGSWCQVREGGGACTSLPDVSIATPRRKTLLARSAPPPGQPTLCLLFPSLISHLITGSAFVFQASVTKHHKPGGLNPRKVIVPQFWKLRVQKQGVSRPGHFRGLWG